MKSIYSKENSQSIISTELEDATVVQLKELNVNLIKTNSLKAYLLRGFIYGIGAAIGATVFTVLLVGLITRFIGRFIHVSPEQQTEQVSAIIKNIGLTY